MYRGNVGKRIVSVFLVLLTICVFWGSSSVETQNRLEEYLINLPFGTEENLSEIKSMYLDSFWKKGFWIDLNGTIAKTLNMKGYYSDKNIYVTDGQYTVGQYEQTSTDYEYQQMVDFSAYLDEKGIDLLYVSVPSRYGSDEAFLREFGVETYLNRNTDLFLERISEAGIAYIDLREEMKLAGLSEEDIFYRTDHHWNTESGLWATTIIAEELNEKYGFQIDMNLYAPERMEYQKYEECWLGEQGQVVGKSYVGLDDYTLIKPKYETDFTYTRWGNTEYGDFNIFLDETRCNSEMNVYDAKSCYYTYLYDGEAGSEIQNNQLTEGKVLILGESYSHVVSPFLALGIAETGTLVLRASECGAREYIENNEVDMVVMLYSPFMIGAHDNPESANYEMFNLER